LILTQTGDLEDRLREVEQMKLMLELGKTNADEKLDHLENKLAA